VLAAADLLFFFFHSALILFNVFGWAHPKLRKWNLLTLLLTLTSWVVLGAWKGLGYCICTEWHFNVRRQMGIDERSDSYLELLSRTLFGASPPTEVLNSFAGAVFVASLIISIALNLRDWRATAPAEPREEGA